MKKTTVLNAQLSYAIANLGHTDSLTVCDAGLPIPDNIERIDLALMKGIPTFVQTLETILTELFIERILLAEEIKQKNPEIHAMLLAIIKQTEKQQGNVILIEYV